MWSPRATGVYTAEFSPLPTPMVGLEEGSALPSQPSYSLGPPPNQAHMVPPNPSAFQRKSTPYVSDSFTLQLAMGGQRAGRLASKPPTPIGGLESMCTLQGQGAVKAQPFQPGVGVGAAGQVPIV